ncbi:DM13 domain-containing protein [Candidatus Gracilibacteria bacterium 28_42_T64]|nr:DM13 domain-containing protein [Candidatus Gracilibacteria bacterium 28_42_T64]
MKFTAPIMLLLFAFILVGCTASQDDNTAKTDKVTVQKEVLTEKQAAEYEAEKAGAQETQAQLEKTLGDTELPVLASGIFAGIASGHNAEGGITVKDNGDTVIIELGEDFVSDKGPDLFLILTQNQLLTGADPVQLDTSKILKIDPLVSLSGRQMYEVSKADFEANNYGVAIWCNQFNVVFGGAVFK